MPSIYTSIYIVSALHLNSFSAAWILPSSHRQRRTAISLDASVGIFFGTSTGSTETVANLIYQAFGEDVASEPIDIDSLEDVATAFAEHDALVVGTPTWNTGADTERSGTGWDEIYYTKLPELRQVLTGKKCAVFGLGDQVSYAENYADAAGELFDVFSDLGCQMMGFTSQEGYEHEDSKSIRGDKFCGLLCDMVNQEELTEGRVEAWVAQLIGEGILEGGAGAGTTIDVEVVNGAAEPQVEVKVEKITEALEEQSTLLDQTIGAYSTGGYTPHFNPVSGRTMWTSADGRKSYVTVDAPKKFNP